jgi:lysophospholipase L1-like esterase
MILVNGDSFTAGEESPIAWPSLISNTINLATPGASNEHILYSTMDYLLKMQLAPYPPKYAIIAWTSPNRISVCEKHLTPSSGAKYGQTLVDEVFRDWDEKWARERFLYQQHLLGTWLERMQIKYLYVSTFDIQTWATGNLDNWLGWPNEGIVEWMGDCPKGPGGHPLELGHQRIAEKINEHIRHLGWVS